MGPQNVIMGDDAYGIDIPETQVDDQVLTEVKKMAKFTRTAEYKRQEAWAKQKIEHYQKYLPDGRLISQVPPSELAGHWAAANEIISVLNEFLTSYEQSVEDVKEMDSDGPRMV